MPIIAKNEIVPQAVLISFLLRCRACLEMEGDQLGHHIVFVFSSVFFCSFVHNKSLQIISEKNTLQTVSYYYSIKYPKLQTLS